MDEYFGIPTYMNISNSRYASVYFDCDSTLVDIEGLDELADLYHKKDEVARLTDKSMSGMVKLEDVFSLKLAMIRPKRKDFDYLGKLYIKHVVDDVKEVVSALKYLKKTVVVMTGNFYPAVLYLTRYLNIEDNNIFANQIHFDDDGNYLTFDSKGPLSIAGGKRSLMLILKRSDQKTVFVGDGATDIETRPPVDLFVGYGGVIVRENIKKQADAYIQCRSMAPLLSLICTHEERAKITASKYKKLLYKGDAVIKNGKVIKNSRSW